MRQILIIETSPRGPDSVSRKVSATFRKKLETKYPGAKIATRELDTEHLPFLDGETLKAIFTNNSSASATGRLSDTLTEELLASDLLVISTPMWNFGIPATLKAWLDLVLRAGKTFRYSEKGAEGLAKNKKAILIISSGAVFSDGPWKAADFVEPYLRQVLSFIGIADIQTVRVEGLSIPTLAANALPAAESALEKLSI